MNGEVKFCEISTKKQRSEVFIKKIITYFKGVLGRGVSGWVRVDVNREVEFL